MKRVITFSLAAAGILALSLNTATAAGVYGEGSSTVVAIDVSPISESNYPGPEGPGQALDQISGTKYLNFSGQGSGLIVTPGTSDTVVQSLTFTTANDAPGRDPLDFDIYGIDDIAVTSLDNSTGTAEPWNLIGSGNMGWGTDPGRFATSSPIDIVNGTDYDSYRIFFTNLRDNNTIMQVADVQMYTGAGGTGTALLAGGESVLAISSNIASYPSGENAGDSVDMDSGSKYLHFGKEGTGIIIGNGTPTIVDSLTFTTANDAPDRDPTKWILYGTMDAISSTDNSTGDSETWIPIDSGTTGFDTDPGRGVTGAAQAVGNTTAWNAYRLVFTELRNVGGANSMQVAEIEFGGAAVPEPTSLVLALLGLVACGASRRKA